MLNSLNFESDEDFLFNILKMIGDSKTAWGENKFCDFCIIFVHEYNERPQDFKIIQNILRKYYQ